MSKVTSSLVQGGWLVVNRTCFCGDLCVKFCAEHNQTGLSLSTGMRERRPAAGGGPNWAQNHLLLGHEDLPASSLRPGHCADGLTCALQIGGGRVRCWESVCHWGLFCFRSSASHMFIYYILSRQSAARWHQSTHNKQEAGRGVSKSTE